MSSHSPSCDDCCWWRSKPWLGEARSKPTLQRRVRALSEHGESGLTPLLAKVLATEEAGGLASLSAACFTREASLSEPLSRASRSRHPVVAFAAEVARLSRGEARGGRIASLAPKIKEAHRLALCSELFVSVLSRKPLPVEIAPALAVLRDAERHLGRWLLLGEVATRAGDPKPLQEALVRAKDGPESARTAWSLVAWALDARAPAPSTGPRWSWSRASGFAPAPSATASCRVAAARVPARGGHAGRPHAHAAARRRASVRAALQLCRGLGQDQQITALLQAGKSPPQDALRGWPRRSSNDCGQSSEALRLPSDLGRVRQLPALGWAVLVR